MNQIIKLDYNDITVAEVKRLIVEAGPKEFGNQIHATQDEDGRITILKEARDEVRTFEFVVDEEFVDLCRQCNVIPRSRYARGLDAYSRTVSEIRDQSFKMTHGEFARLAAVYGLDVVMPPKAGNPGQPKLIDRRIEAIELWLSEHVADRFAFSKSPGRGGGGKGRCRGAMLDRPSLFFNESAFKNTWDEMLKRKLIGYKS